jgi:3-isopropylmalate/(R)-2-methylmalate dehydratase small subunit
MSIVKGRVRNFGDNVDTDIIAPAAYLHLSIEELTKHAFEPIMKEYYKTVWEGDIIVAGNNFGCGSSREQATDVVKKMGFKYIVCQSMARIYFRNCIATGVYPIIGKDASGIFQEGDEIEIDIDKGSVKNPGTGKTASFQPIPDTLKPILNVGGILELLKKR